MTALAEIGAPAKARAPAGLALRSIAQSAVDRWVRREYVIMIKGRNSTTTTEG